MFVADLVMSRTSSITVGRIGLSPDGFGLLMFSLIVVVEMGSSSEEIVGDLEEYRVAVCVKPFPYRYRSTMPKIFPENIAQSNVTSNVGTATTGYHLGAV